MQQTELGGEFQDERDPNISKEHQEINELIRLAQNRNGSVQKQVRDEAMMHLCRKFRRLICKKARETYRKANPTPYDEWEHEAITTFIELVLDDYRLKEDGGAAFFGHYINQKLYYRLVDKAQRVIGHYNRQGMLDIGTAENGKVMIGAVRRTDSSMKLSTNDRIDIGIDEDGITRRGALRTVPTAVFGSMVANFYGEGADSAVIDYDRREFVIEQAQEIMEIAKRILKEREFQIFSMHYASGKIAKDIEPLLKPHISVSRIRFIARQARRKVLEELGRQRIRKTLL